MELLSQFIMIGNRLKVKIKRKGYYARKYYPTQCLFYVLSLVEFVGNFALWLLMLSNDR